MYVTRHDWLYHEMQMHRRRWVCSGDCDLSFGTRDAVEFHMREKHHETFTELQLPVIIDLCERPADPNKNSLCPLCPAEMTLSKLQVHLATHLEELALFVLPVYMSDKSERSGSNQGGGGNDDPSRMGDLPSLGSFSDAGVVQPVTNNDPARISNLVRDKDNVENSTTEVQSWLRISQKTPLSPSPLSPTSSLPLPPTSTPELTVYTQMYETARRHYEANELTDQSSKSIGLFPHREIFPQERENSIPSFGYSSAARKIKSFFGQKGKSRTEG
jgi:hypothetical protein